ncbi:fimbrial biogenesis chaperone [Acinetobacter stercoris]|uniref:Chaperone protein EcpD n=1 Tax=Acinetobacter stercoris TaxID=2126983 RepID=A0A2U3MZQ1_9GAMM|nr:molecular chaperone [Acinetobacter stercoris]SPL70906.1 Chaperone protein EcpD precursor [Acinetobacter stercoris]
MKLGKKLLALSTLYAFMLCSSANAAIQAQATRVIYNSENSAATLSLKNNSDKPYMVQTWLSATKDAQGKQKIPMVVIPPLLKIESDKESILRFIYSGQGLPTDRESLLWINIQEIPPKPEQDNVLQIAIRSKLKLFYRPKQIKTSLDEAAHQLQWYQEGKQLKVKNASPLHVTIGVIKDAQGKTYSDLNEDLVAPYQSITVLNNFSGNVKSITYTYINDYGGATTISSVMTK